jgi:Rod binding domain-containing protein
MFRLESAASPAYRDTARPSGLRAPDDPAKVRDAARQFEALLLTQILRAARGSGSWTGSGPDGAGDCATEYAEEQFAAALASSGGLGLADLISSGLTPR